MIYTVTLNPAIDYMVQLDAPLAIGQVNRNKGEAVRYGGKGINVSGVLKALGQDSVALGFVAGFTGDGLENGLKASGLCTDFVHVEEGLTRINVKVKADQETEINGLGPVITDADMEKLYARLEALTAGDYLVLSGSAPSCLNNDVYKCILERIADRGIFAIVDATGALLLNALPYRPFLVKPNNHELEAFFDCVLTTDEQIMDCGRRLQEMGARNVLVSMAGDGAMLLDENGNVHRIRCPKGTVVNSVGAGDSMVAGFLAGYVQTGDHAYALKLGTAAGSATAFSLGLADQAAIQELMQQL